MVRKNFLFAVSSAVLLFTSCTPRINADNQTIDNLNNAINDLSVDSINKPSDAINYLKDNKGIDVETISLSDNRYLAFDMKSKQFVLMNNKKVIYSPTRKDYNSGSENTYDIFKITDYYDSSSEYSQYLTSNFEGADTLVVTTGIDTGVNKNVKTLIYNNNSGVSKDVILNTYCDYLKITAPNDSIKHFGDANNVFISALGSKYHEYGTIAYLQAEVGNIYFEKGSSTDLFEITEDGVVTTRGT